MRTYPEAACREMTDDELVQLAIDAMRDEEDHQSGSYEWRLAMRNLVTFREEARRRDLTIPSLARWDR